MTWATMPEYNMEGPVVVMICRSIVVKFPESFPTVRFSCARALMRSKGARAKEVNTPVTAPVAKGSRALGSRSLACAAITRVRYPFTPKQTNTNNN